MLKLVGAMLVLIAGTMIGYWKAAQYARRPKHIRQLVSVLQRLETEIVYGLTPLPDALISSSRLLPAPLADMFRHTVECLSREDSTTGDSWKEAAALYWPQTALGRGEKEIMERLAFSLGTSDRDDQMKHLKLAVSQLQAEELEAGEQQKTHERMWKSMGILCGMLAVILMY